MRIALPLLAIGVCCVILSPSSLALTDDESWSKLSKDVRESVLAAELEQMNFSAGVAQLLRTGETEQAIRMLEGRLSASTVSAERLLRIGTDLPLPSAEFLAGAERASRYAAEHGLQDVADRTAFIVEHLR